MAGSSLLINEPPLQLLPSLAVALGGVNEAIVLQQVQYWISRSENIRDGRAWVYKTYPEWKKEFPFWSEDTIRRTIRRLEVAGILLSTDTYNKIPTDRTKWYSVDYDVLNSRLPQVATPVDGRNLQSSTPQLAVLLPETTTETTTEIVPETTPETTRSSKPRARDPLFDAIAQQLFGLRSEDVASVKIAGARIGVAKRAIIEAHGVVTGNPQAKPSPSDVSDFCVRYRDKYQNADLPRDSVKIAEHWIALMRGGLASGSNSPTRNGVQSPDVDYLAAK